MTIKDEFAKEIHAVILKQKTKDKYINPNMLAQIYDTIYDYTNIENDEVASFIDNMFSW